MLLVYEDRPAVLEAILEARRDRHLSYQHIAETLVLSSEEEGFTLSAAAVKTYCNSKGIR